ncbi:MAG: type II toxin-antitoxin system VapC family toxin [Longimicrobiales bacterium]
MILADTSVWTEHLRRGESRLAELLEEGDVCVHPMVLGELACGLMPNRGEVLELLRRLPRAQVATDDEALHLIDERRLMGRGIGWVDVHLIAATLLMSDARLWTKDARLAQAAARLFLNYEPNR